MSLEGGRLAEMVATWVAELSGSAWPASAVSALMPAHSPGPDPGPQAPPQKQSSGLAVVEGAPQAQAAPP